MTRFTDNEGNEVYLIHGKEVTAEEYERALNSGKGEDVNFAPSPANFPMKSMAMEVHPKQIDLAKKLDRERGAPPTDYTLGGRPIWTSESHKRKFNRAHGKHDNNSYLG